MKTRVLAALAVFSILGTGQRALAQTGPLDATFGTGGRVITDFGGFDDYPRALVLQPDGKLVAAGHMTGGGMGLARYNPDGSLDTTFGNGGKAYVAFGGIADAFAVVLQPDGKLVAAGGAYNFTSNHYDLALARFESNGNLDDDFGTGGTVTLPVGGTDFIAEALVRQPDGKLVAAGSAYNGSYFVFTLVRFDQHGTLDMSFGSGGKVTTDFGNVARLNALVRQPDGKLVAAGEAIVLPANNYDFVLARYLADGSPDTSFGSGGWVATDFFGTRDRGRAVVLQPDDGKIVVAGGETDFELARYNTNGSLDTSFGVLGKVKIDVGGDEDWISALVTQPDGMLVAAGSAWNGTAYDFVLTRYNDQGSTDTTFGTAGRVVIDFVGFSPFVETGLVLQPDGKLVVAAHSTSEATNTDFALARYDPNATTIDIVPPTAALDVTPRTLSGPTLTLSGIRSTDVGGTIAKYRWQIPDADIDVETITSSYAIPVSTLSLSFGLHAATLIVTDTSGNTSTPVSVTFNVLASQQITPTDAGSIAAPTQTINDGIGSRFLPHVSKDLATYLDRDDFVEHARYFRFSTSVDAPVPVPLGQFTLDWGVDVDRERITLSRVTESSSAIFLFDPATNAVTAIEPGGISNIAIGGDTVAFDQSALGGILAHDLASGARESVDAPPPSYPDRQPRVSPDGKTIVFSRCAYPSGGDCDVFAAERNSGGWVTSPVAGTANFEWWPDTDGNWIVYAANSAGVTGFDVFFQPTNGDIETGLAIAGDQTAPAISEGVVSFVHSSPSDTADIVVYDIVTNALYKVTSTPSINEATPDVSVLDNGDVRVVWIAEKAPLSVEYGVYATTFSLPPALLTVSPVSGPAGSTFTLSATLTAAGVAIADQLIRFSVNGGFVGAARTDANGVATFQTVLHTTTPGAYPQGVLADFSGFQRLRPAISTAPLVVTSAATTMSLQATPNPAEFGQPVTLTASLSSTFAVPSGEVLFTYRLGSTFRPLSAPVPIDAGGVATLNLPAFFLGDTDIRAEYAGNVVHIGSEATATMHVVKAATQLSLTSTRNPSLTTGPPVFFALIDTASSVPPTGNVEFSADGQLLCRSTVFVRGTRATASCGGAPLAIGSHSISANYLGSDGFESSRASELTQVVAPGGYFRLDLGFEGEAVAVSPNGWVTGNSILKSAIASSLTSSAYVHDGTITGTARLIPSLGGAKTVAVGIDDAGRVGGSATTSTGATHVFLFNGVATDDHHNSAFGGVNSRATAMNASGTIVGFGDTATGAHAFIDVGAGAIDLGVLPGGANSAALAISSLGHVVGVSGVPGGSSHAASLAPVREDLGTLGGATSAAAAVNNAGESAGFADLATGGRRAFLHTADGNTDVGSSLSSGDSLAIAINDSSQVLGSYLDLSSGAPVTRGFIHSLGVSTDLGLQNVVALNNAGEVVTTTEGRIRVRTGGTIVPIGGPVGSGLSSHLPPAVNATSINDEGRIAGSYEDVNRRFHAAVWIPVPLVSMTVNPARGDAGGAATLTATLTNEAGPVPTKIVYFRINGAEVGSAPTDSSGIATLSAPLAGIDEGFYPDAVEAFFDGDEGASAAFGAADLTVDSPEPFAVTLLFPVGGERVFVGVPATIRWTTSGQAISFDVEVSTTTADPFHAIAGCTNLPASATTCVWTPVGPGHRDAHVRVIAHRGEATSTATSGPFAIVDGAPTISVTSPNNEVHWGIGSKQSITWSHNLGAAAFVRIELSRDGGTTFETLAEKVQNAAATTGEFPWEVTGPPTNNGLFKVTWIDGPAFGLNNVLAAIEVPRITVKDPNGGEQWAPNTSHKVKWTHNLGTAENVSIEVSRDGGTTWTTVAAPVANNEATSGQFDWLVTGPTSNRARVRVRWLHFVAHGSSVADDSDSDFTIASSRIRVTTPDSKDSWAAGSLQRIWFSHGYGPTAAFDIDTSTDGGATWVSAARDVVTSSGWAEIRMPSTLTTKAFVRVSPAGRPDEGAFSAPFALVAPNLWVSEPNGSENWVIDSRQRIEWRSDNLGESVSGYRVYLSYDSGVTWGEVFERIEFDFRHGFSVRLLRVAGPATTHARVRVTWSGGGVTAEDISDAEFTIASRIQVTAPDSTSGPVTWAAGSLQTIRWTHDYGSTARFDIDTSTDGGTTWASAASNVEGTRAFLDIRLPSVLTTQAQVRVSRSGFPADGEVSDVFALVTPQLRVSNPNGNETWLIDSRHPVSISWSSDSLAPSMSGFRVYLSSDSGVTWREIDTAPPDYDSKRRDYDAYWKRVAGPATTHARVRVTWSGGGFYAEDISDADFTIVSHIQVTEPNAAVTWGAGSLQTIAWTHDYGGTQTFDIDISTDGGVTWTRAGVQGIQNTGSSGEAVVQMPAMRSAQGLVRVSPSGRPDDGDVNDVPFTIVAPQVRVTEPNGSDKWVIGTHQTIEWSSNLGESLFGYQVSVSRDGGATWESASVAQPTPNPTSPGAFSSLWTVAGPATAHARMRVTWSGGGLSTEDISDGDFEIASRIHVDLPNAGDRWGAGSMQTIHWLHDYGPAARFDIDTSPDGGQTWTAAGRNVEGSDRGGFATIRMPSAVTSQALVRVSPSGVQGEGDISDQFALVMPQLRVSVPNGNEAWVINSIHRLEWFSDELEEYETGFRVYASYDSGLTWRDITSEPRAAGTGKFSMYWSVAGPVTTHARVRVRWSGGGLSSEDISDGDFEIASGIHVDLPNAGDSWGAGSMQTIHWLHDYGPSARFDIDTSTDGGLTWTSADRSVPGSQGGGFAVIRMPSVITTRALVRVSPSGMPRDGAISDPFGLVLPQLKVSVPNGNEHWVIDSIHRLEWFSDELDQYETGFRVYVSYDSGVRWQEITSRPSAAPPVRGRFIMYWPVEGPVTTRARVRVQWRGGGLLSEDISDTDFTIAPVVNVTLPDKAVTWVVGSVHSIKWTHNAGVGQLFDLDFSPDAGANWTRLVSGVQAETATNGSYDWIVPDTLTTQALIRVSPSNLPGYGDTSDTVFAIARPRVR